MQRGLKSAGGLLAIVLLAGPAIGQGQQDKGLAPNKACRLFIERRPLPPESEEMAATLVGMLRMRQVFPILR